MRTTFKNLFEYNTVNEYGNIFMDIKLHKSFPDDEFVIGDEEACVVISEKSYAYIQTRNKKSKSVTIDEWIKSNGLCRTDAFIFMVIQGM